MRTIGFNGFVPAPPADGEAVGESKPQRVVPIPDMVGDLQSIPPGAEILGLQSASLPGRVLVDRLYYGRVRLPGGDVVRFVFYGGAAMRLNPNPLEMLDDLDVGDGAGFWTLEEVSARRNWSALRPAFGEEDGDAG